MDCSLSVCCWAPWQLQERGFTNSSNEGWNGKHICHIRKPSWFRAYLTWITVSDWCKTLLFTSYHTNWNILPQPLPSTGFQYNTENPPLTKTLHFVVLPQADLLHLISKVRPGAFYKNFFFLNLLYYVRNNTKNNKTSTWHVSSMFNLLRHTV